MRALRAEIARVNRPENQRLLPCILLTGETGAGKYWVSQVIAGHARWNGGQFREHEPNPSADTLVSLRYRRPLPMYHPHGREISSRYSV